MKSILEFDANQDYVLKIKNLSISYDVPYYKSQSFRDIFVEAMTSPIDYFLRENDKILLIDNISLTIQKGERVGILGNNGSGKTSLCRYISGIHNDPQGRILINGEVRGIFDTEVAIMPELSGGENLEILIHFFYPGLPRLEREKLYEEIVIFCELGNFIDVPFKLYSKGMKARLFLSLISSRPANLLVLDEVFSGADHFFNAKLIERMDQLIHASEAVIFVSHSLELIEKMCNRAIVLNNNKIEFDGKPAEAINYYKKNCEYTNIQRS